MAWRLKLSSTFVYGVSRTCVVATARTRRSGPISLSHRRRPMGGGREFNVLKTPRRFGTLVHFLPAPEIWSAGETDDGGP